MTYKKHPEYFNPMWGQVKYVTWPLLGPQVTYIGLNKTSYECVILQDLTQIIIINGIYIKCEDLDAGYIELINTAVYTKSDTCIEFSLPKYYDPSLYEFYLSAVINENK